MLPTIGFDNQCSPGSGTPMSNDQKIIIFNDESLDFKEILFQHFEHNCSPDEEHIFATRSLFGNHQGAAYWQP